MSIAESQLPGRPSRKNANRSSGDTTIIFKVEPSEICENCGAYYLSEEITEQVLSRAKEAVKSGAEAGILRFAA